MTIFSETLKLIGYKIILKGIINDEDWQLMKERVNFNFIKDGHFSELKDAELLKNLRFKEEILIQKVLLQEKRLEVAVLVILWKLKSCLVYITKKERLVLLD